MFDLVIKGGRAVLPDRTGDYDLAIRDGKIAAVVVAGALDGIESASTIDATGKVVVPGGIDPHVHVNMELSTLPGAGGQARSQGYEGTSRACAFGGTTTIVDFSGYPASGTPLEEVEAKKKEWDGGTYVDYTLHCTLLGEVPIDYIDEIPAVVEAGVTSFKVFTRTWPVNRVPSPRVDDGRIAYMMRKIAAAGGVLAVHAENDGILSFNVEMLEREGRDGIENVHLAHDNLCEEVEVRKLITLARRTGSPLYLMHQSAHEPIEAILEARREGLPVWGETIHNYLAFTADILREDDGVRYLTHPGQKYEEDRQALWAGLLDGSIATVGTDEVATNLAFKLRGKTVATAIGGHNGVETRMPYVFSEGVSKGRLTLEQFVAVTSGNAARIFGMYPQKGALAPGSDADIVLIDPELEVSAALSDLHADIDYSIWEGWDFKGWPVTTILRGKPIVDDGKLLGELSDGKFVHRHPVKY